jgi:hypothetical protein
MGYSAIPVMPGAKFPGVRSHGEWYAESGWQRFCDRLPTEYETRAWATWEDAGVCIALGMNDVVAVDIDTTDEAITQAIMSVLPPSPVGKRGAKGYTLFFRANVYRTDPDTGEITGVVKSKPYDVHRERVVDLLCHGRQTVLPPSIHPETGRAYSWLDDDAGLSVHEPDDLPMLPDDIAEQISAVLEPFGYVDIPDYDAPRSGEDGASDTPWAEVNRLARENFDAWVPELGLPLTKRSYRGTYRAAAAWRGGDGPNVSFHPRGIKDMKMDRSLSPLDVVMLATGSSLDLAFRWLSVKVGYKPTKMQNLTALLENAAKKRALADKVEATPTPDNDNLEAIEDEPQEFDLTARNTPLLDLTRPGGLVEDLVDWVCSSNPNPSRELALSAVLPFMGALMGQHYATGERSTRANIYSVALAESGFGKEHARTQIKRLVMASHGVFDKYFGPARIMSASALREVLETTPCVNCMIDEFGGFVRDITDKRAGAHQKAISVDLRDYYSASSTFFEGAAYRGQPAKKIYHPMLCVYGTSTPDQFWNALSSASAEDGLLPRLVLFNVEGDQPPSQEPSRTIEDVPNILLERLAAMAKIDVANERFSKTIPASVSGARPTATKVPWDDQADAVYDDLKQRVADEVALVPNEAKPFVRRIVETTQKLALIAAVGTDYVSPVVRGKHMEWAAKLAWSCSMTMVKEVSERMADNLREANYKRISSIIKKAGKAGLTMGTLVDKVKGIETRQREDILKDLKQSGKVNEEMPARSGTGRPPKARLFWA